MDNYVMFARIAKSVLIFQVLILSSCFVMPAFSSEHAVMVALVIDDRSRIHDKAVVGIKRAISKHGNKHISYRIVNINDEAHAEALGSKEIDYAIVVGVKPALFTLKKNPPYPVLYSLVPESTYKEIISKYISPQQHTPSDDYVIYLGQKASRQLMLTEIIMGKKSRVGIVVGEGSGSQVNELERLADNGSATLVVKQTASEETVLDDMKKVLLDSDVYLATYDSNILNRHNAKWLLYMAYQMSKPVVGFSPSYTRAGAVASIFSTPEQVGKQGGEWVVDMFQHRAAEKYQRPKYFSVTTNSNIQRLLRLKRLSGTEIENIINKNEKNGSYDQN